MSRLVGVIDAGTNSVRFALFKAADFALPEQNEILSHEIEIRQISLNDGWLEHNPVEIIAAIRECASVVIHALPNHGFSKQDISCIGITNQRETVVVWDKLSGKPLYNAIVWKDNRTTTTVDELLVKLGVDKDHFRPICGLPLSPTFSAPKIRWLKKNIPAVQNACREGRCLAGTIDSWIVFNLIKQLHVTDVTNASRTLLMNLSTLTWDNQIIKAFSLNESMLPEIKSSSEIIGTINDNSSLDGLVISAIIGNQQASLLGQLCLKEGQAKSTYRSGCFLLCNIGPKIVQSSHGLITTVGWKFGRQRAVYALEGNIAVGGAALKWMKDNLELLRDASEIETIANKVPTTAGCYFVPAFRGLFAPYYQKEARGVICGLTAFTTKHHIVRAGLETVCYQITDVIEAMRKDAGIHLKKLHVDGKMARNNLLMQLQADISGIPILRSQTNDTTSFGCALAAARADGINLIDFSPQNLASSVKVYHDTFLPSVTDEDRKARNKKWKMAIQRSYGWATKANSSTMTNERYIMLSSIPFTLYLTSSFFLLALSEFLL